MKNWKYDYSFCYSSSTAVQVESTGKIIKSTQRKHQSRSGFSSSLGWLGFCSRWKRNFIAHFLADSLAEFLRIESSVLTAAARLRQETSNGRLKFFEALQQTFRHHVDKQKLELEAICVIVQYQIDNGSPIFDV
jgi:hypothetical protein